MQVEVPASVEARYAHLAELTGRPAGELIREAIEHYADYEERLIHAVEEAHVDLEVDEFLEHEQLKEWIGARYRH
jgi:predicted transcriptional regulator